MPRKREALPTTQYIESLYESGNLAALTDINEKLAKRANTSHSQLERSGMKTAAYNNATYYLSTDNEFSNGRRSSRSNKMEIDDLYKQVKQETKFLRSKTSSVSGETSRRNKIFEALTTERVVIDKETGKEKIKGPVVNIPDNMDIDVFKDKFLKFLDDDAWKELKKNIYTKNILNEAGEAIAAGASLEELTEALDNYMYKDEGDLDSIWDNWISVGKL